MFLVERVQCSNLSASSLKDVLSTCSHRLPVLPAAAPVLIVVTAVEAGVHIYENIGTRTRGVRKVMFIITFDVGTTQVLTTPPFDYFERFTGLSV